MIIIITESRNDAIGKYNDELIKSMKRLEKDIKYININNKIFGNKWLNYIVEIYNSFYLLFKLSKEDKILFTDPKAIKASIAFILHNEKYVIVHHLDKHPTYYKIIPFFNFEKFSEGLIKLLQSPNFPKFKLSNLVSIVIWLKWFTVGLITTYLNQLVRKLKDSERDTFFTLALKSQEKI
jgi:hypothetical protein